MFSIPKKGPLLDNKKALPFLVEGLLLISFYRIRRPPYIASVP